MVIGDYELEGNIFLAPMAGITDHAFRSIVSRFNISLTYTEMISAKGLFYNNRKTRELLKNDGTYPLAVQIFGHEPEVFAYAAAELEDFPIIDINMGCPAPKIVKNCDGAALMQVPSTAEKIVKAISGKRPVTVKMRIGFEHNTAVDFAKRMEQSGAAALTVHGRLRSQFYSGSADWETIQRIKESVSIPIIGNGDIKDRHAAIAAMKTYKCDGIMIGRAAMGNPWVFAEDGIIPDISTKLPIIKEHMELLVADKGERIGALEARKHLAWYFAGLPHSSELRKRVNSIKNLSDIYSTLADVLYNS